MFHVGFPELLDMSAYTKVQADDELTDPYLLGFEWDKEESWTRLVVHLAKAPSVPQMTGKKGKKK